MNSTVVFAKHQQNLIWKHPTNKVKHRPKKMTEEEYLKAMEEVKSLTDKK